MPGLSSLSRQTFTQINEQKASAYLVPFKDDGDLDNDNALRFQYFPDTVQDTKAVNWSPREVPGGSLPIYQWISSGERLLSFTAVFTCDMDLLSVQAEDNLPDRLKNAGHLDRNVDIRAAVAWLRYYMFPEYGIKGAIGVPTAIAPRRLMLVFPHSGMSVAGGIPNDYFKEGLLGGEVMCIMTQCDVTYEAFFPSGLPRIATVSLAFAQIAQMPGTGPVFFPGSTNMLDLINKQGDRYVSMGYNLEVILPKKG
jgi:hypothetical protein